MLSDANQGNYGFLWNSEDQNFFIEQDNDTEDNGIKWIKMDN